MKHFRVFLPLLFLALVLSGCGSAAREPYEYTFSRDNQVKTIRINPETQTILDGTNVYTYQVEASNVCTTYVIDYPNGAIYHWMSPENGSGAGGWSDDYDPERYIPGNILVHALEQNHPRAKIGNIGMGILLVLLGAVNFFLPELPFYLRYGWAVRDAEPSDTYLTLTRIGGVILVLVGFIQFFI